MEDTVPEVTRLLPLPFDVQEQIFSYLTQAECLECSLVCRSLYNNVPSYSQSVWAQFYIDKPVPRGIRRFLGPHVKTLKVVDWDERYPTERETLYKTLLTVDLSGIRILASEAPHSLFIPRDTFLRELQADKIEELRLKGWYDGMAVCALLERNASHLRSISMSSLSRASLWPNNTTTRMPHLVKLELNVLLNRNDLERVLDTCPNLEFLDFPQSKGKERDFEVVFAKCPKLRYLGYRHAWPRRYMPLAMDKGASSSSQRSSGSPPQLAHLNLEGDTLFLETAFLPRFRSFATYLESIVIDGCGEHVGHQYYDWTWLITNRICLPRLRYLYIRTIRLDMQVFVRFIGRHAASLQALGIHSVTFNSDILPDTDMLADAIRDMQRLEHLYFDGVTFTGVKQTEIIRAHRSTLRGLQLCHSVGDIDLAVLQELSCLDSLEIDFFSRAEPADALDVLKNLAAGSPGLRTLTILNVHPYFDDSCLETITRMRNLRSLTLSQCSGWSDSGLLRFAQQVRNRLETFRILDHPSTFTN